MTNKSKTINVNCLKWANLHGNIVIIHVYHFIVIIQACVTFLFASDCKSKLNLK